MKYIFLFVSFLFIGCSSIPSVEQRVNTSNELIKNKKIKKKVVDTSGFLLYSLQKVSKCEKIRVYIEGDGLSWLSRTKISSNPTPINPLAQKLFIKDESACKIYFARPCQYISNEKCKKKYWTSHRYSKEVIASYNQAFEKVKKEFLNKSFEVVGFSGGGTIAVILAGTRSDISYLLTVAGNLDHKYWTQKHKITELRGSVNPVDYVKSLEKIEQLHLIGAEDKIIDDSIFNSYFSYFNDKTKVQKRVFKGFSHQKGWVENWENILKVEGLY